MEVKCDALVVNIIELFLKWDGSGYFGKGILGLTKFWHYKYKCDIQSIIISRYELILRIMKQK